MHGDFSNITFSPDRSYSTVFDLQGRVGLDANRNEQTAILLHYLRTAMADLVGPYAGPATSLGFEISDIGTGGFSIGAGRYYVDGILVENPAKVTYAEQPHAYIDLDDADRLPSGSYVVYLKVWERHVTEVEDPSLHEPALGLHQPDSASRAQVVWQVRALPLKSRQNPVHRIAAEHAPDRGTGVLDVRTSRDDSSADDPCTASPDASYTGENQLYRVEIRRGGTAADGATFAWSRDNGSVIHPVRPLGGTKMRLTSPARDRHTALEPGHWVEVVDDAISLRRDLGLPAGAPPLHRIDDIDPDTLTVILATTPDPPVSPDRHPYLRRWDHTPLDTDSGGAIPITEGPWIPLEHGIEIHFQPSAAREPAHEYRCGDHWTFAARRTLGTAIWPYPGGSGPHGVRYHLAPLAVVAGSKVSPLRTSFAVPLTSGV
ncbi:hypothetical protein AQJ43_29820 [Streptomyces avermitilis]|uniref:Uncharacterized protein n=1 Tax=Streptomyces avermitilis (strain ATCC 31267 / DSM 46492 / JCM 5070 / NBRC 14893 / NCIMB 12804 / NRRL 8165 / MA-4680) TaxID=227882 RepID=Q82QU8_STRAW|nr:DUF6519 domain-containing protein [Streptomyces avermitilis]KUN51086.1 hypothetical protein AQJ43_29820 [Streptomyces avermitilis]MYS96095.1 hypothetical protein [Streptomyces sp. SID5469]OOV12632.1 hypothetical protein SM007_39135 [Streptomyces avermitilis]BAC68106.1 hypothetical protein SAVERM_397 [Streptomyces avermitilis MA-4680 = NBRC 14893]